MTDESAHAQKPRLDRQPSLRIQTPDSPARVEDEDLALRDRHVGSLHRIEVVGRGWESFERFVLVRFFPRFRSRTCISLLSGDFVQLNRLFS
jgi:hypothetical protein